MKVKSSQDRSGHDRSSQVRTSLVREGVWNTKKDPTFFNPNQTHTAIVCGPGEVESIQELFSEFEPPFDLEEVTDLENSILTE